METNYSDMLAAFGPVASEGDIAAAVAAAREAARERGRLEVWRACLASLDVTSLGVADTERSVAEFAGRAARMALDFPHLPRVAAVCVWPLYVDSAALALGSSPVAVASVAGGFPSSQTFIEVKMLEAAMAVESGADEVDVVIAVGEAAEGDVERMAGTLELLRAEVGEGTVLKVIVESGVLARPEKVREASLAAMMAGADFVKTSTGKAAVGATPEAAVVMCAAIRDYYERTGRRVGFKAAGGVSTAEDAVLYHTIVERTLGPEWLTPELFRIGASGLANDLLTRLEGRETKYF
jgi:deoxyribose-phosphate aldolase